MATIVNNNPSDETTNPLGWIIGAVVVGLIFVLMFNLINNMGRVTSTGGTTSSKTSQPEKASESTNDTFKVDVPDQIDVNVNNPGSGGPEGE